MIDYLESMLEEEAEEEEVLEWSSSAFRKNRRESTETEGSDDLAGPQEMEAEMVRGRLALGTALEMHHRREEGKNAEVEPERSRGDLLSFAESRRDSGAWLYAVWKRRKNSLNALSQRENRTISVTLPERTAGETALSAESLDRLVERDARRYDGGFPLY